MTSIATTSSGRCALRESDFQEGISEGFSFPILYSLQVAGLPPVTKEWFEARRTQLAGASAADAASGRVWVCPLTKKKFASENTYLAHTRSKKYQELVKKSERPMPAPIILTKIEEEKLQQGDAGAISSTRIRRNQHNFAQCIRVWPAACMLLLHAWYSFQVQCM